MREQFCSYSDQREQVLVAYLYDDIEPGERARFLAHLAICARCRDEVTALTGVRDRLARWAPPEPAPMVAGERAAGNTHDPAGRGVRSGGMWAALREMPVWTQAAAAMLVLGLSAGIANLDVRYDQRGVSVRTGWKARSAPESNPANPAPWRADVAALEQQLRTEFHAVQSFVAAAQMASVQSPRAASPATDPELVRRLRGMIDESERRQQRELALRVADVMRELDTQRRADLMKIDRSLGVLQNNTGVEVMKQRELLNYLVRVSQKQ